MSDKQETTIQAVSKIQAETNQLVTQADKFEVANQLNYDAAAGFLKNCLLLKKKIELFFEPSIDHFKKAKKAADDGRAAEIKKMEAQLKPVTDAIAIVQKRCKDFENEQEKLRIAEQARLDKEAEEKAEALRLEKEEEAKLAKDWGDDEEAEKILEEAKEVVVEEVKAKPTLAKSTGLGIRRSWKWKIINEAKIPRKFLKLDEVAINAEVRTLKENTNIPGIEAYED